MVDLGGKIKQLRQQQRMTQVEFADRLGVTKSTVSAYEGGNRQPSYEVLLKMARIFKVSTDYLLGQSEKNDSMINTAGLTSEQICLLQNLIETFRKDNAILELVPEDVRKRVQDFVETGNNT